MSKSLMAYSLNEVSRLMRVVTGSVLIAMVLLMPFSPPWLAVLGAVFILSVITRWCPVEAVVSRIYYRFAARAAHVFIKPAMPIRYA